MKYHRQLIAAEREGESVFSKNEPPEKLLNSKQLTLNMHTCENTKWTLQGIFTYACMCICVCICM